MQPNPVYRISAAGAVGICVLALIVGVASGYAYGKRVAETLPMASLSLPAYLESTYPGAVKPLHSEEGSSTSTADLDRTVTKDAYITWLEDAVTGVQFEEMRRGEANATRRVQEFVLAQRAAALDVGKPMTAAERKASFERISFLFAENFAVSLPAQPGPTTVGCFKTNCAAP